jgi:hypothetical protein
VAQGKINFEGSWTKSRSLKAGGFYTKPGLLFEKIAIFAADNKSMTNLFLHMTHHLHHFMMQPVYAEK